MAEDHGFQSTEGHRLCANNCGFFGSPATLNLCSKCYRDFRLKEEQDALAKAALGCTAHPQPIPGPNPGPCPSIEPAGLKLPGSAQSSVELSEPEQARPNRCSTCRKRVGLTGFRCRCGSMFCGSHRYPEKHGCSFDYKTLGKEAIAKANPVIKAEKLEKS